MNAGDQYGRMDSPQSVRRLASAFVLRVDVLGKPVKEAMVAAEVREATTGYEQVIGFQRGDLVVVIYRAKDEKAVKVLETTEGLEGELRRIRGINPTVGADPVFIDPGTGLMLIAHDELIVRLRDGEDAPAFFGDRWKAVQPGPSPTEFIVPLPGSSAERLFAEVSGYASREEVIYACPNFISEGEVHQATLPNDPLFSNQWHLRNTGQLGHLPGADVDAASAWSITSGNSNVWIAVIDDGV